MAVSYTQAGFEVTSLYSDASQLTKHVDMPNISWQADYTVVDTTPTEATLLQKSGADLSQYEKVRIGRQEVPNIYAGTPSINSAKLPDTRGVQAMVELKEVYKATSQATGVAYDLPVTARVVVRTPYNAAVNKALIQDAVLRACAMLGAQQGSADFSIDTATRTVVDAVRGDLTPFRSSEQ